MSATLQTTDLVHTPREAAEILKISPRTLFSITQRGLIKPMRIGPRVVRYPQAEIERFIQEAAATA